MKQGFALIVVLMILSITLLMTRDMWYHSFLTQQYAQARYEGLFKQQLLDTVDRYAISFCTENKRALIAGHAAGQQEVVLDFDQWAASNGANYAAGISIKLMKEFFTISTFVAQNDRVIIKNKMTMSTSTDSVSLYDKKS